MGRISLPMIFFSLFPRLKIQRSARSLDRITVFFCRFVACGRPCIRPGAEHRWRPFHLPHHLVSHFSSVCVNKSYTSYGNKSYQMRWKNCFYTIKLYHGNILYIHRKRKNIHVIRIWYNFASPNDKFWCLTYYFSPYNINFTSMQQMLPTGNGKCLYDCRNLNNRRNIWQYIYRGKDSSPTHEIDWIKITTNKNK